VPISAEALELEQQFVGDDGAPTLRAAYALLREQWLGGERDRELALHLMFLAWYMQIEPEHLTGCDPQLATSAELPAMFNDAHEWLLPRGEASDDAEALYVTGFAAALFTEYLGDVQRWRRLAETYRRRYRELAPAGIAARVFAGRGAYGDYFEGQTTVADGY
jgi:hypothetical protein